MKIRIGSRGSALALAQSNGVAHALAGLGHDTEIIIIQTAGDRDQDRRFSEIGAPGVFVREIEAALLKSFAAFAVSLLPVVDLISILRPGRLCGSPVAS